MTEALTKRVDKATRSLANSVGVDQLWLQRADDMDKATRLSSRGTIEQAEQERQ
jgi:hypothetical protein